MVYSGPVAEKAELKPDINVPKKMEWKVGGDGRETFVVCHYEGGVSLARSVGKSVKTCTASFLRWNDKGGGSWGLSDASAIGRARKTC